MITGSFGVYSVKTAAKSSCNGKELSTKDSLALEE